MASAARQVTSAARVVSLDVMRSCSGASSDNRIIGYYASSAYKRSCNAWTPENIDAGLWTHLIFAFALVGSDYRISQANSYDEGLYTRFTALKDDRAGLSTLISVGGWDAGGEIFSDMVSTATRRSTFIASAISFMATYGFDGIDVDWEYPAASDRGGSDTDTANYVTFVKELKEACGDMYKLTVTLPSSYWYLQGFDVTGMEPYVDWFHFMSYDIHGTWDGNSPYTEAVVQPHTNLTEIKEGLDLLWRNDITPGKVVLGEAFYGRSFTLSDTSCTTPGCPFSGGGDPGECTDTSGILSDTEIENIITEKDLTPVFDKTAAVKYMVWDEDQWVSFDDSETLDLKRTFANDKCLGGRMIWSIDLDNITSKAAVVSLNAGGLELIGDSVTSNPSYAISKLSTTSSQNSVNLLAYWTNCSPNPQCNAGYSLWTLGHGKVYDADKGIYTADGCHGGGNGFNRGLCVESDVQGINCQWYGKPKGCSQTCPSGTILLSKNTHVGGAKSGCKSGHFSSYCCESITTNILDTCPQSNANNALTGGLGIIRKDASSVELFKDDSSITTIQECATLLAGFLALVATASFILNIIPGHWSSNGIFTPIANLAYPQAAKKVCTTTTTTHTTITTLLPAAPSHVTCDGDKYPQACGHYSSVIYQNGYATLTCPVDKMKNRKAPGVWSKQHIEVWRYWVPHLPKSEGQDKCNRDEYPPFAFMEATGGYNQWIRFLPATQNQKAGQLWKKVCAKNDKETKTEGGPIVSSTCTEVVSTIYSVGAMVMHFTNVASDYISANPCLPEITDDPGFALETNDPWYAANILKGYNSAAYKKAPVAALTRGKTAPRFWSTAKRWTGLDQDGPLDLDFDPEDMVIDEGNISRRATPGEIYEELNMIKCESDDCKQELEAVGLSYDDEGPFADTPMTTPPVETPTKFIITEKGMKDEIILMEILTSRFNDLIHSGPVDGIAIFHNHLTAQLKFPYTFKFDLNFNI
ncbi:hypothetical protein BDW75DRAFT_246204 [Aspergillus navahoensis]